MTQNGNDAGVTLNPRPRATEVELHGINTIPDADRTPRVMSLREVLRAWLDHRHVVLVRRTEHRLAAIAAGQPVLVLDDAGRPDPELLRARLAGGGRPGRPAYVAGDLLWRVQLRRGLIDHKGRRLPATAVIGVRFNSADLPAKAADEGL